VAVRVADDGPGVPPALAGRIFHPHVHGASSSAGAGLGLAIAQAVVAAHGGRITLEAVPAGASFLVTLPIEPAQGGPYRAGVPTEDDG
jgi:signal transduction histidine kinase